MISPALLPDTFTRQTLSRTADGMGGWTETWSDDSTFQGRLGSLPAEERLASDKVTVYATHRLYCNNLTISEEDRVKLGSRLFEIKAVRNPSNINDHLELDLLEVD